MNLFVSEIVTPPAHLPVTVAAADMALAAAVVEEIERVHLWRGVVSQTRRILVDGVLPILEIEPVVSIVSLTRWTEANPAEVIDPASYSLVSRDPSGALIAPAPGFAWPAPMRPIGSFALTYMAGWEVEPESAPGAGDAINNVPSSVILMLTRAIEFRAGSGLGDLTIGSLKITVAPSYKTDALPREITGIARAWAYRPGLIAARP